MQHKYYFLPDDGDFENVMANVQQHMNICYNAEPRVIIQPDGWFKVLDQDRQRKKGSMRLYFEDPEDQGVPSKVHLVIYPYSAIKDRRRYIVDPTGEESKSLELFESVSVPPWGYKKSKRHDTLHITFLEGDSDLFHKLVIIIDRTIQILLSLLLLMKIVSCLCMTCRCLSCC